MTLNSKLDDKKKQKIEDDENSAEAVRNRSMERLSETNKRETVDPQTKQARKNGSATVHLIKEEYKNDTEIRPEEL